jgi:hypothetical protein
MGPEDIVEADLVVVEEAVGGGHLGVSAAGGGDAGGGVAGQLREDLLDPSVEPLVLEIDALHLLDHPWSQHRVIPRLTNSPGSPLSTVRGFTRRVRPEWEDLCSTTR